MPGTRFLTPEEALKRFEPKDTLDSLLGSGKVADEFNVANKVYAASAAGRRRTSTGRCRRRRSPRRCWRSSSTDVTEEPTMRGAWSRPLAGLSPRASAALWAASFVVPVAALVRGQLPAVRLAPDGAGHAIRATSTWIRGTCWSSARRSRPRTPRWRRARRGPRSARRPTRCSCRRRTRWCARWSPGSRRRPRAPDEPWLHQSLWHSIKVIFWGFLLSSLIGVPLGILCGALPAMGRLTEPFIEFFRYLPAPAFGALAVAVLGIEDAPKVAIIFIGTFFQQVLVIANTTRRIDPALLEAARDAGRVAARADHARGRSRRHHRDLHGHARAARLGVDVPDRRRADRRQLRHHVLHQPAGEVPRLRAACSRRSS